MKRLLAVLLLLTGCARQPAARQPMTPEAAFTPTPQTAVPLSATAFQSATLPDHVFDLYGTALYKDSLQINEWLPAPRPEPAGVFFLLVSSNNPELGVLVFGGPASSYNHLKRQAAGPRKLTGDVKEFDAEELAKKVKERYGVTLCSRSLKLQYGGGGRPPSRSPLDTGTHTRMSSPRSRSSPGRFPKNESPWRGTGNLGGGSRIVGI